MSLRDIRFGLRGKLLLLSSFLFVIPWFGYQYVWEMEKYLRYGQEQTIVGTARALATALHERPNLFENQASFLPSVEKGKDLYGYQLNEPIRLDGLKHDWPKFEQGTFYYTDKHLIATENVNASNHKQPINESTNSFSVSVGKYDKYLYIFFSVIDNKVVLRGKNNRSVVNNDHLLLSFIDENEQFKRFVVSNKVAGWLSAFELVDNKIAPRTPSPPLIPAPKIQGHWLTTTQGYNIELRIPLSDIGDKIAFAIADVDVDDGKVQSIIGSADPNNEHSLGTILVPSPEIERIVNGMSHTNSSIWVIDHHHRVLASTGSLKTAGGFWQNNTLPQDADNNSLWGNFKEKLLLPLYYKILTKPPTNFIDKLYDAQHLTGKHIIKALSGKATSQWRLTTDQQALVLSAAYPIFIEGNVKGAVIVEETTNGIRTLRNQALEKLFSVILAIMILGALTFILFATRITSRIRTLSNQAELAIDEHGRITGDIETSVTNDEIGDLSRSFSRAIDRLKQYNHYLEHMSSRLSHELRTPIAVVKTSLENLNLQQGNSNSSSSHLYIERAQAGINTLNQILTNMSEATRLEQMLNNTEKTAFNIKQIISGCILGYQEVYKGVSFNLNYHDLDSTTPLYINGSPEHIVQLLDKVINNAVDFSEDNIITIDVKGDKEVVEIKITNNGIHLPEAMVNGLFDSMISIRTKSKHSQPHLGLGLYIARLICHFHHGSISAQNHDKPKGVTIKIVLPLLK
ncbi:proteobacterial dedicated sortase system histidine kinase [Colwellia sp. RSH04]|uniref:proteobacterial dedicated sortase system histidine kinase n=1 Tax=Colwellia sp. RSH04 TaxID=2305464 RepID=UPI000E56F8FF|nr:proteobacterial dedicated sortase system histidine kinase [Colwellia sp. RSH04]RHW77032.1 proteobacterial dedicated sortase system histidine kinase [Colwellia sp. RSH04]